MITSKTEKTKQTNETVEKRMAKTKAAFIAAFRLSAGNVKGGCSKANISRQTYYNWIENDADFKTECENIREENLDFAESKLQQKISHGDLTAIIFYLKTIGKKRGYTERQELQVEVPKVSVEVEDQETKELIDGFALETEE